MNLKAYLSWLKNNVLRVLVAFALLVLLLGPFLAKPIAKLLELRGKLPVVKDMNPS